MQLEDCSYDSILGFLQQFGTSITKRSDWMIDPYQSRMLDLLAGGPKVLRQHNPSAGDQQLGRETQPAQPAVGRVQPRDAGPVAQGADTQGVVGCVGDGMDLNEGPSTYWQRMKQGADRLVVKPLQQVITGTGCFLLRC